MQSPFGRPLFDRLGLNPAAGPAGYATMQPDQSIEAQIAAANKIASTPTPSYLIPQRVMALRDSPPRPLPFVPQRQIPSRALPLPQGFDPNVNQPSIGDFDGVNGLPSNPFADIVYRPGPGTSLTALNQMTAQQGQPTIATVPGLNPVGRPVPLPNPGGMQPEDLSKLISNLGNYRRPQTVSPLDVTPEQTQAFQNAVNSNGSFLPVSNIAAEIVYEPNPFLMNGRLPPASNIGFVRQPSSGGGVPQDMINSFAAMSPEEAASLAQGRLQQRDLKPPAVQKFLTDVAGGNYDFGPGGGQPAPQFGPPMGSPTSSVEPDYTGFVRRAGPQGFEGPKGGFLDLTAAAPPPGGLLTGSFGPSIVVPPQFRQPGDMGRYVAFNDRGQPGAGFSNYQEYLAAGNSPAIGGIATGLGSTGNSVQPGIGMFPLPPPLTGASRPPFLTNSVVLPESGFSTVGPGSAPANVQPINSGGGLSNMAFPTLAPSRPNTFTGGLFGGNNPMNNNPMNGGGMNSNQPLSQQIPQVVQQAVTPLLQNTATQLNQGIGSMVNQSLVGGGGQTGSGGGGLPAFGGTPAPSNLSNFLLGGGFNPFR